MGRVGSHALILQMTEQRLREFGHLYQSHPAADQQSKTQKGIAHGCGPAKASVMKVVRTLQTDGPLNLWHSENSGGGQGSIRGVSSQEVNGYKYHMIGTRGW